MAKRRPSGDGLVRKRADGRWEGRIVVGHKEDGKPIYRSVFAEKQSDLMPKLHELKDQYAGVELTEDSSITLGEWLGRWLEEYKKPTLRPSTFAGYSKDIANHILPYLGAKKLTQLKTADIQKHYNRLLESGRIQDSGKGKGLSSIVVRTQWYTVPEIVNSAFACEVFMKSILIFRGLTIDEVYKMNHGLKGLWGALEASDNDAADRVRERIKNELDLDDNLFDELLSNISNAFKKWRYIYEDHGGKIHLDFLSTFRDELREEGCQMFYKQSWSEYSSRSE